MGSLLCSSCGTPNSEFNQRCTACGTELSLESTTSGAPAGPELVRGLQDPPLVGWELSHYRVLREIGAGGMGRVYAAEDKKLGRVVALKVLPPPLAADPERLERFRREARAVAALNHPNIVTLHSVEESGGLHFLTMELVEGQTLDRLVPEGGVSLETFFELALGIVDALGAAHRRHILHRDLKLVNIMRSTEGIVKVLDFGLAKIEQEPAMAEVASLVSDAVTPVSVTGGDPLLETAESKPSLTTSGRVMGTIPYMSPEQLRGKKIDQRSDLFSLGVILFELATGRRPFVGHTAAEVISSILRDTPPPVHKLRSDLPPALGAVIERLLAKEPEDRFQSAREVRDRLRALERELKGLEPPASTRRRKRRLVLAAVTTAVVLPGLWLLGLRLGLFQRDPLARLESAGQGPAILRPERTVRVTTWPGEEYGSRISPDGRSISWIAAPQGSYQIWIQRLDGAELVGEPKALTQPTPKRITSSVWSPDGKEIAYLLASEVTDTELHVVHLSDGSQAKLTTLGIGWPAYLSAWREKGIFLVGAQKIWMIEPQTTELSEVFQAKAFSLRDLGAVDVCEDGRNAVAAGYLKTEADAGQRDLWLVDLEAGSSTRLLNDPYNEFGPRWLGPGCQGLVYSSDRTGETSVWHLELDGAQVRWNTESGASGLVEDASRDGSTVLVQREQQAFHLESLDLGTGLQTQLTSDSQRSLWPSAAATAPIVAYQQMKSRPGRSEFFGEAQILLASAGDPESFQRAAVAVDDGYGARLSPDGRWLAFLRTPPKQVTEKEKSAFFEPEIWCAAVPDGKPVKVGDRIEYSGNSDFPLELGWHSLVWSRDSKKLYFIRKDDSGVPELRVAQPDGPAPITGESVAKAMWPDEFIVNVNPSADGRLLTYTLWPHSKRRWIVHELSLGSGSDHVVIELNLARPGVVVILGWIDGNSLLLLECIYDEPAWNVEVGILTRSGQRSRLGSIDAAFPATARYDPVRRTLFITAMKEGVHNVFACPIEHFNPQDLTRNPFSGVSFTGVEVLTSGDLLLGCQKENTDVWLNHFTR
jgi:serine/threonine protein kinase/Tol biopolymer transport system component